MNYDQAGRLLGRVAPNTTEQLRSYEALTGRMSAQTISGGASIISGLDYSYTPRGNIAQIVETGQVTQTRNYDYDALERLTSVEVPNAPGRDEIYQLDEEGNRLSSHLSQTHVTDAANRLLSDDADVKIAPGERFAAAPR